MKREEKNAPEETKKSTSTKVMYIAASVAALFAVVLLVCNIILFKSSLTQYVTQGYPVALVLKQLIPAQLLPGVFEPIALYGGIAILLFAVASINEKVSKCLISSTNVGLCQCDETAPETVVEDFTEDTIADNETVIDDQKEDTK